MNIEYHIQQLSSRLPELEWKISVLGSSISTKSLPRGLFRYAFNYTPASCISEIKTDIKALASQKNENSASHLADRIHQKISVLVGLCQRKLKQKTAVKSLGFGLKKMSTRQHWLQSLRQEISLIQDQKEELLKSLHQAKRSGKVEAVLEMTHAIGHLEKQLTLIQEKLNQALE